MDLFTDFYTFYMQPSGLTRTMFRVFSLVDIFDFFAFCQKCAELCLGFNFDSLVTMDKTLCQLPHVTEDHFFNFCEEL